MPRAKKPTEPTRPTQAASPPETKRRFGRGRPPKKPFDVHVADIDTGEHVLTVPTRAPTQQEAIAIVRRRLWNSPLVRHIAHAAYSAEEAKA